MKPKSLIFILVLALQSAWVLYTVAVQESALREGTPILLETERVDPRDLLRGDYLILNYKISSVPKNLFSPPVGKDLPVGTKVFVALAPSGEFHSVVRASTNEFQAAAGELLVKGRSAGVWWNRTNSVHVEYGLEKYFVREGTGNPNGKLTVQAVVPSSGRASIKQVLLDGKPYVEAMKEQAR
jgi:uncharacterized membrane-anchored protein